MDSSEPSLLDYFKKYHGLLSINSKNLPKTTLPSSIFVTPKIGHSCVELLRNPDKIYDLTNKSNSMLLITDSSEFIDVKNESDKVDVAIPHLESISIYYKHICNIDSYPIVLDSSLIKNGKDLMKVLINISPAYSAIELYKVEESRILEAIDLYHEKTRDFVLFTSIEKTFLEEALKKRNMKINSLFISSCIFRAALYTQAYVLIPKDLIEKIVEFFSLSDLTSFYENYYQNAEELIAFCANYFIENDLSRIKITVDEIEEKYQTFLIEGNQQASNGLIEIQSTYNFNDPFLLDSLFTEEGFNEVSDYLKNYPEEREKITLKNKFIANVSNKCLMDENDQSALFNLPFMEGQASYSHHLGLPELMPICLEGDNMEETLKSIAPIFKKVRIFSN